MCVRVCVRTRAHVGVYVCVWCVRACVCCVCVCVRLCPLDWKNMNIYGGVGFCFIFFCFLVF